MAEPAHTQPSKGRWYILGLIMPHVPHHLSGSRQHLDGGAGDQQGIRLRQDHDGRHLQRLRVGLRAVPGSRRLAQRPLRRPHGADRDRRLLVDHDGGDRRGDRRRVVCRCPFSVRHGRSRRLSGRDPRDAALVSAPRARSRTGADPQCEPARCRHRAADRRADHDHARLALRILHLRRGRFAVVGLVVFQLSQLCRKSTAW